MADVFGKPNGPSAARVCNHFPSTERAPEELVQRWKYPICCCSKKDITCHIIISNLFLVLVVSSQPQHSIWEENIDDFSYCNLCRNNLGKYIYIYYLGLFLVYPHDGKFVEFVLKEQIMRPLSAYLKKGNFSCRALKGKLL
ncbi:hypothetical protein CEXT_618801 [Caerostris extrusa]|uniref:FLZ-type domain-containing protein n=1 Tax=Caerostris extrusa TaxID=172846 RepID=A0AAV4R176_CAEEX|nr:hypothetical protein CEXT_618801 [Caerostris extrusa]